MTRGFGHKWHQNARVLRAGYQSEEKGVAFELVQKAGAQEIDIGSGFRHFSVTVPSIEGALQRAMDDGYDIIEGVGFEAGEVYIRVCVDHPPTPSHLFLV